LSKFYIIHVTARAVATPCSEYDHIRILKISYFILLEHIWVATMRYAKLNYWTVIIFLYFVSKTEHVAYNTDQFTSQLITKIL